jgi:hypothetical protein
MTKRPEDRFQTAGSLARAARQAIDGLPLNYEQLSHEANATAVFDGAPQGSGMTGIWSAATAGAKTGVPSAGARRPAGSRWIAGIAVAVAVIAATIVWAVLAGPLASKDGRLAVNSSPPGANVRVDGSDLGLTPLSAQTLPAGSHEVVVDKPGYVLVKKTEQLRARATETLNTNLTALPAIQLLSVQQALLAKDVVTGPNNTIGIGAPIASVRGNEEFGMVVTLAAKPIAPGDISFSYQFSLVDPSGVKLAATEPINTTVGKSDASGLSYSHTFHFNADSSGSYRPGNYLVQFLVDGEPLVTRPISLAP